MTRTLPNIAVVIPTFNRRDIVIRCISALMNHLRYAGGDIHYYVGVDGNDDTAERVRAQWLGLDVKVIEGPRRGLGVNLNNLHNLTSEKLILQLDDDHILLEDLQLDPFAAKLTDDPYAGWIRLMGIGSHNYRARLVGSYWEVDWASSELYITSNRPHLKTREFIRMYGPYPEDTTLGNTEEFYCHHCKDRAMMTHDNLKVLVPLNSHSETAWDHIGQSWQLQGY